MERDELSPIFKIFLILYFSFDADRDEDHIVGQALSFLKAFDHAHRIWTHV